MKMFLASVGNAQLLGKKNGVLKHIADVRTLTESTLGFTSSMEEVRAGEGAKLYGRFNHSAGMTVTLTDAMFDLEYIAQQVGAEIEGDATAFYDDAAATVEDNILKLTQTPADIGSACGLDHAPVWVKEKGCGAEVDWIAVMPNDEDKYSLTGTDLEDKTDLCVRYFVNKPEARKLTVNANFIPAELVLILTTKLFAGDANAPESGKPVGYITVKVPRFQLDGQFDLNMAMAAAATMSLNGTALAVEDGTCDGAGVYAEIVEVKTKSLQIDGLKSILVDPESAIVDQAPIVYGFYQDGHISTLNIAETYVDAQGQTQNRFTFSPALDDGKFSTTGATTVTIYNNSGAKIDDTTVAVDAAS